MGAQHSTFIFPASFFFSTVIVHAFTFVQDKSNFIWDIEDSECNLK